MVGRASTAGSDPREGKETEELGELGLETRESSDEVDPKDQVWTRKNSPSETEVQRP